MRQQAARSDEMGDRMSKERTPARRSTFTISMILGLLLIPLSAVAAIALVDRSTPEIDESAPIVAAPVSAVVATTAAGSYTDADLAHACGDDGSALLEKEADGTINSLEQAALDALRPICEGAGMPLAGPPAPAPIVRTVRVTTPAPAPAPAAPVTDDTTPAVDPVDAAVDPDDDADDLEDEMTDDDVATNDHDDEADDRGEDHDEDEEEDHDKDEDEDDEEDER